MRDLSGNIRKRAAKDLKKIVLAEGEDIRVIKAAKTAIEEGFAKIVLLGDCNKIKELAKQEGLDCDSCDSIEIINPEHDERLIEYTDLLYNLRKKRGLTEEQAVRLVKTPLYFATLMVKTGAADGMVCGCVTSSADVMRAALQVIKTAKGVSLVSTSFLMNMSEDRVYAFADCVVNVNPNAMQIADIAISSAETFESFVGEEARVAMLSYTTYGKDTNSVVSKMQEAAWRAKSKCPDLNVDGEMQLDAAIDEYVANIKIKNSMVGGRANVLIFPDLNSGNISYKLVQRLGGAQVIGPIMQGLALPVNDLSRGCTADEIADAIAVTALQAHEIKHPILKIIDDDDE